ncbi:MAG TPA: ABC transporter substrate-binding protein [Candidatus Tectomicrobia bacterium]|nr:ABC transporter substrate-binding protein [Candidatus Tectomicrobia bacterium]
MTRRSVLAACAAVAILTLALPASAQQPRRGGVIRIADREAPNLDPHLSISFLTHSWASMAYSQLVRFAYGPDQKHPADFTIMPDLAEKWEYASPTTVVFTLRKGVRFHNKPPVNGREVTSADVKWSLERFRAKSGFKSRLDDVQSIETPDKYTVRITTKEPFAPLLNHLASPTFTAILPREVEEKLGDFNRPEAVIGTGPFVLKSYQKGVRIVWERNPDYFVKGLPYVDAVELEITPDANTRLSLLRAGKVDFGHMWGYASVEEGKSLQKTNPEIVVTPTQIIGQGLIYMRTDQPPFNDVRVRRAVSLAIDRKAWNDALFFGEGCIDSGPVPCAMKEWKLEASAMDPAKAKYLVGYDPAEAKKLLAEAGHRNGFTTPAFHWPGYAPPWRSIYELVADNLGKIGIQVELKPEEYGKYISTTYLGKFEKMAIGPITPFTEVDDWLYGTHAPEQPNNRSHVADAELNRMLVAQRRELDPKKRKAIVDDIQRYLADKAYYVYFPNSPQYISHARHIKGFKHHDGYGMGPKFAHTWIDK